VLINFIEQSREHGQMAALAAFRERTKSGKGYSHGFAPLDLIRVICG
jgi:hypothetical protein